MADLEELGQDETETKAVSIDDLVVVAEFKDTIYPGLVETGRVQRGGDKPFHTVINAENFCSTACGAGNTWHPLERH